MITHLYVESAKVKFTKAENRVVVTMDWGMGGQMGGWERPWPMDVIFQVGGINLRDSLCNTVTVVNNDALKIARRGDFKCSLHKKPQVDEKMHAN